MKRKAITMIPMLLALTVLFGVVQVDAEDEEVDKTKPVIEYAYVEDGKLILSISDEEGLDDEPIVYKIDKEIRSHKIDLDDFEYEYDGRKKGDKIYEIKVEIPSSISLSVIDEAGNETKAKYSIKEDYVALTKTVPEFVLERLAKGKQSDVNTIDGYDDIFELEYGKVANNYDLFDKIIDYNYYSYNKEDIKFKIGGLSSNKEGNIKLDKFGVFKVTMTHSKDKTFEETAFILVKPDWTETKEKRELVNLNPYIVYKDKIKVADYFGYKDDVNNAKKSKIDTTYLLVHNENTGKTVGMNDQINLEMNKINKLKVLNFEDNSEFDFYVMRQEKVKSQKGSFTDLKKDNWATNYINSIVSDGLLSGYPDGTFRPKGKITVKEFMAILSRQIAITPEKGKLVVGNSTVPTASGSWGYIETKSIFDRLSTSDLAKFNYRNLDRPINRGEVAFLMDKVLELGTPYEPNGSKSLRDVSSSKYNQEITKLVGLDLVKGYTDGTFRPYSNITRAEIAAIFAKIE